ncbi:hypothetical protein CR513_26637, partial [Mucuna pruriens]
MVSPLAKIILPDRSYLAQNSDLNLVRLLGEAFPNQKVVEKIMVSRKFEAKISTTEESCDLQTLIITEITSKLHAQEQRVSVRSDEAIESSFRAKNNGRPSTQIKENEEDNLHKGLKADERNIGIDDEIWRRDGSFRVWIHITSTAARAKLLNLTSVLERTTMICFLDHQDTKLGPKKMEAPEVGHLSSRARRVNRQKKEQAEGAIPMTQAPTIDRYNVTSRNVSELVLDSLQPPAIGEEIGLHPSMLDYRGKRLIIVITKLLVKALGHTPSFILVHSTIKILFNSKNPLAIYSSSGKRVYHLQQGTCSLYEKYSIPKRHILENKTIACDYCRAGPEGSKHNQKFEENCNHVIAEMDVDKEPCDQWMRMEVY